MKKIILSLVLTLCLGLFINFEFKTQAEEDFATTQGNQIKLLFDTDFSNKETGKALNDILGFKQSVGTLKIHEDDDSNKYASTPNNSEIRVQYGEESWTDYYVESEIFMGTPGSSSAGGVSVRYSNVDGVESFYTFRIKLSSGVYKIFFKPNIAGSWKSDVLIGEVPTDVVNDFNTKTLKMGVAVVGQSMKVYINGEQIGDTYTETTYNLTAGSPGMRWYAMREETEGSKWYGAKVYSLDGIASIDDFDVITDMNAQHTTVTLSQGASIDWKDLVNVTPLNATYVAERLRYEIIDSRVVNYSDGKLISQSVGSTTVNVVDPITGTMATINVEVTKGAGPEITNICSKVAEVKSNEAELIQALQYGVTAEGTTVSVDTSLVNVNELGRYIVTYTAALNDITTTVQSFVDIVDTTAPVITLDKDTHSEAINTGTAYTLDDFRANIVSVEDNYDDLVSVEILGIDKIDIYTIGDYIITYRSVDTAGNETLVKFTFTVYDDIEPAIVGTKNISHNVGVQFHQWMFDIYAEDNADGKQIPVNIDYGNYQYDKLGEYTVTYYAVDTSGNRTEETVTVTVTTTTPPTVDFKNEVENNTIEVKKGEEIDLKSMFVAKDVTDLDISEKITFEGDYDLNKAGTYIIKAKITDEVGNLSTLDFTLKVNSNLGLIIAIVVAGVGAIIAGTVVFIKKR